MMDKDALFTRTDLNTETAKAEDQRRFRRYVVNFPCVVKPHGAHAGDVSHQYYGETKDVSSCGLFFVAFAEWTVGTEIDCELLLPLKAFAGRSIVIRCRGKVARVVREEGGRVGVGATIESYKFLHLKKKLG